MGTATTVGEYMAALPAERRPAMELLIHDQGRRSLHDLADVATLEDLASDDGRDTHDRSDD